MIRFTKARPGPRFCSRSKDYFLNQAVKSAGRSPPASALDTLYRCLDEAEPRVVRFFLSLWQDQEDAVTYKELREAYLRGEITNKIYERWTYDYARFVREHLAREWEIAAKAAARFFEQTNLPPSGLSIDIRKRIPVCAGMAGGSSDGAAVLRVLRRTLRPDMSSKELEEIGSLVGSDVPYCLRGGSVLAEGRGERMTDLPPLPPCWFVVCKPPCAVSTPELFSLVRMKRLRFHPRTAELISALEQGDLEGIAVRLYNVFEDVLPRRYAQVFEIKGRFLELGAMAASMTGSGPTVFGLFRDKPLAVQALEILRPQFPSTFLCELVGRAVYN